MAELYLAKDTRSNRMVVLKRILPYLAEEVEFLTMFLDEARIAAQLHHPNIVEVFELGRLEGSTFIAMEWVDGPDLRKVLQRETERGAPIPPGIGAWVIARLCEGLHHAHQRRDPEGKALGIIHRDVSPQNVMVSYAGDVKLVDFGIAKATAWMSRSKPGVIKGKFLYLAPEQLTQDKLDHRADLFAVGTLLYELTVGKSPFYRNTTEAVIYSIRMEDPAPPQTVVPGYPPGLSRIVMRCLEKDRTRRYQSAEEVRAALDGFIQVEAPTTREDVGRYMAELFGDDDERTSVYVPPNAQTNAVAPMPAPPPAKRPSPFADDDRTVSIPGAPAPDRPKALTTPGRSPTRDQGLLTTDPILPPRRVDRDVQLTAPIAPPDVSSPTLPPVDQDGEQTNVGRSAPTLAIVDTSQSMEFGPTRVSLSGVVELKTGDVVPFLEPTSVREGLDAGPSDPSISTVSEPPPKLLVPPPRARPAPPVPDDVTGPTRDPRSARMPDRTAQQLAHVPQRPGPPRPSRRRNTSQQKKAFDIEDHIATVDMASFEDSAVTRRKRVAVFVIVGAVAVLAGALLVWALWPSQKKPAPKPSVEKVAPPKPEKAAPPPPAVVKVTFRAPPGTRLTIGSTSYEPGATVEVPPGKLTVRYVCPPKRKQRARTLEYSPEIPASAEPLSIDLPCL
ncbi:MAG: serine/threonine protein kinase [Myxococcaceae bacterium]|nr:serine/threonine protein kinase [Myxococcaceae bacterium]